MSKLRPGDLGRVGDCFLKLCFDNLGNEEIEEKVQRVLSNLGLDHISHLRVGSRLDKTISGGQRKRLNK